MAIISSTLIVGDERGSPVGRLWNHSHEAEVTVRVGVTHDRYVYGEVVIEPTYHYPDGSVRQGHRRRVALAQGPVYAVPKIWDVIFDEVVRIQQEGSRSIVLALDPTEMNGWSDRVRTVIRLVAHELGVPVSTPGVPER
jgi:hypothetical protein